MMEDNLVLSGYGVILRRLTHDKIELLRKWRNDPKIQQYMFYREEITPQMQERWFQNLDKTRNYYFIIEYEGKDVGMTNLKDIDFDKGTAEPGIFIYDDSYLNSPLAFMASCCICDFGFENLGLTAFCGHILQDNKRAKRFNEALGYRMCEGEENKSLQRYSLTKDDYVVKRDIMVKLF